MNVDGIPRQYDRKPDPSEPWRYVCPDCRTQVAGRSKSKSYECKSCRKTFPMEALWDKKHGRPVQEDTTGPVGE